MSIYAKLAYSFLGLMIVLNWGMLMSVTFRKIGARMAGRHGIPFRQPWINLLKNMSTRTIITHGYMYYLGPVFRLTGGIEYSYLCQWYLQEQPMVYGQTSLFKET